MRMSGYASKISAEYCLNGSACWINVWNGVLRRACWCEDPSGEGLFIS
jgi:hypothetical protein